MHLWLGFLDYKILNYKETILTSAENIVCKMKMECKLTVCMTNSKSVYACVWQRVCAESEGDENMVAKHFVMRWIKQKNVDILFAFNRPSSKWHILVGLDSSYFSFALNIKNFNNKKQIDTAKRMHFDVFRVFFLTSNEC